MDVAEELLDVDQTVDSAYVERRIDDWKARIAELYTAVKSWLPPNWIAREGGTVSMREELMHRFDMPEERLPILLLDAEDGRRGRIEPRGLWIIGANGRVDLIMPNRHFLIVNREESFEPPVWQIASLQDRLKQEPFDRSTLGAALA